MKQILFLLLIFSVALLSCNNKKNLKLLSADNLKSYFVTLNADSGYFLKTPKGALIKIAAKTFDLPGNSHVKVVIKEAYSMQDIVLAGLSTESNGKPLRSAGMLYFNATANNKAIVFLKPVAVTIPAKFYDSSMQVFDAEFKKDSSINWINPQPVDTSPALRNLSAGKALFRTKCASCHKPSETATGPSLAGARERSPTIDWAYKFVNNSLNMVSQDPYARRLKAKYGSVMTQFNLPARDIKAILDYCDNEAFLNSGNNPETAFPDTNATPHPCGYDTFYYAKPKENIATAALNEAATDSSSVDESNFVTPAVTPVQTKDDNTEDEFLKKGYQYVMPEQGIYQFNIEKSGWYNIDVLFDEPLAEKVQLFTEINMQETTDMTVYLCIPKRKILMEADRHNGNIYLIHYSDANGFLPMVINDDAFIFATASVKNKIYYGITKFTIRKQQKILIKVKESTREQILNAIKSNQLDSIKLDIEKQEMKIIKRHCDGEGYPATDSITLPTAQIPVARAKA